MNQNEITTHQFIVTAKGTFIPPSQKEKEKSIDKEKLKDVENNKDVIIVC